MSKQKVLVVGGGGLAREVSDWFADVISVVGYACKNSQGSDVELDRYLGDDVLPEQIDTNYAILAVGVPKLKETLHQRFLALGFCFPTFIHDSAYVSPSAELSEGVVVAPNSVISTGAKIGIGTYLNLAVTIGHEGVLGDFCQVNPGVQIGGGVTIGSRVLIGSGATILQGIRVGDDVTIASGSTVFSRVKENTTMLGNPARRMRALES